MVTLDGMKMWIQKQNCGYVYLLYKIHCTECNFHSEYYINYHFLKNLNFTYSDILMELKLQLEN